MEDAQDLQLSPKCSANISPQERSSLNKGFFVQLLVVMAISIGHMVDGTVLAYTSPAVPSLLSKSSKLLLECHELSFVRAAHSMGATLGCLIAGTVMGLMGRRGATLWMTGPSYLIGYVMIGSSINGVMMVVGRLLTGIGLGLTLSIPTIYIVEITSMEFRGVLGVLPNLFCQIGILGTYAAGHWLDWSWLAYTCSFLCIPFIAAVILIPESPTHLTNIKKHQQALKAMQILHISPALNPEDPETLSKVDAIPNLDDNVKSQNTLPTTTSSKFKPFLSGLILMLFFQCTAYPILIGYTEELFREANGSISETLISIIVGVVIVVAAVVAVPLARTCNRKSLLMTSAAGVSACLYTLGTFFYLKEIGFVHPILSWIPLVDFIFYVGFFMTGYGSVSWLVFAEILPPTIRSSVFPIGIALMWLFNFVITMAFEPLIGQLGFHGTVWLYATISVGGVIFIFRCIPETRNRSEKAIAAFYSPQEGKQPWKRRKRLMSALCEIVKSRILLLDHWLRPSRA